MRALQAEGFDFAFNKRLERENQVRCLRPSFPLALLQRTHTPLPGKRSTNSPTPSQTPSAPSSIKASGQEAA
jgi:hypothetical protein